MVCSALLSGCQQLVKTVEDTIHPRDTVLNRPVQQQDTRSPYETAVEQQIKQIEQQVTSVIESHITTTHREMHKEGKPIRFITNAQLLNKAETTLRKLPQYAGKEIFIYSAVHFYDDGSIRLMLQHPENPQYVDNYEYRHGAWSAPQPQQLSVRDNIQSRLVSLNQLSFTHAAGVARIYNEKAGQIEGAKPATAVYATIWDGRISWFPSVISGSRRRYRLQFKEDGTLQSFEQE